MAKTVKTVCSNCGAPFHGLTQCAADAPNFKTARGTTQAKAIETLIDAARAIELNSGSVAFLAGNGGPLDDRILMELQHDLEDALKQVHALKVLSFDAAARR